MNYREIKNEIKREFETYFKLLGYKFKNGLQGGEFIKLTNFGNIGLGYGITNYIDEFYTAMYIGLSIYKIQKISSIILGDSDFHCITCGTIGSGTSNYFNEINYRYRINTIKDVEEWGKIVRKFYGEYAVPFFNKYNTVSAIDGLFNDNPKEKVMYCEDLPQRIIKALIAAKLNNNPKYNELRDYYKSEVESKFQGYFMYDKCMKVINFLDKYTSEELNKLAEEV